MTIESHHGIHCLDSPELRESSRFCPQDLSFVATWAVSEITKGMLVATGVACCSHLFWAPHPKSGCFEEIYRANTTPILCVSTVPS